MTMPNEGEIVPREYPRTPLRTPVRVWFSGRMRGAGGYVKYHVDRRCSGLERTHREDLMHEVFADAFALGENDEGRPCRMCTLERVLYTVLRPRAAGNRDGGLVFTTFTSQPCPTSPDVNLRRYKWRASSQTGQDRLHRIAAKLNLSTVTSSPGPVAWGFLPTRGADILAANLRTEVRPNVSDLPPADVMDCLWVLLDDNPPQLRNRSRDGVDPWELARLLVG
jgi:hypothetical protein